MNVIVDYGMGNLASIFNMVKRIGASAQITSDPKCIELADKIILPGVGAFDRAMANLKSLGLLQVIINKVINQSTQILGICLGMQLLFKNSEEGVLPGLGFLEGNVIRFNFNNYSNLKVPHMGWNQIRLIKKHLIFNELTEHARFYFVHSYHVVCPQDYIDATVNYGYDFPCAISQNNIMGVQFHPEKSHRFGMKLLDNFLRM